MSSNSSTTPQDVVSLIAKLDSCLASGLPPYDSAVSSIYSTACHKLRDYILNDFSFAIDNHLDRTLWSKLDLAVVQAYQQRLEKINAKSHPVQYRKRYQHFVYFISSALVFYRSLLENLAKLYPTPNFVCVLEQLNWEYPGDVVEEKDAIFDDKLEGFVQRCLVILGDLSRYRETRLPSKSRRNWEPALRYYTEAFRFNPDNWSPLNQLAVVSSNQDSVLSAIYYFYRTLMTRKPCKAAQENLNLSYKKLLKSFTSETQSRHKSHLPSQLIDEFLLLHAKLHFADVTLKQNSMNFSIQNDKVLGLVAVAVSNDELSASFLTKLCAINMSAFKLSLDKNNVDTAYTDMLVKVNISFMRLFLGVINADGMKSLKTPPLIALRLYGYWLSNCLSQGMIESFNSSLWLEIDAARIRLESIEKRTLSPSLDDFLLPEDVDLLGFTCLGKHFIAGYKISDIVKFTTKHKLTSDEVIDRRIQSTARILDDALKKLKSNPSSANLDNSMEAMVDSLVDGRLLQDSDEDEEDEVIVFRGKSANGSMISQSKPTRKDTYIGSSLSSTSSTSQRNQQQQQQQIGISAIGDPIAWNNNNNLIKDPMTTTSQITAIGEDRPTQRANSNTATTPFDGIWKSPFQTFGFS